jgi:hypothetical protein
MWELENGKEDEKEGSKRERRERVLRATLRARMRVEQRRKRDRTRNKLDGRCLGGDEEGERGIKWGDEVNQQCQLRRNKQLYLRGSLADSISSRLSLVQYNNCPRIDYFL